MTVGPGPPPSTNLSLLLRIRDPRDAEAWILFVELYVPAILGYCARRGIQDSDARDIVQDVLAKVTSAIRTFEYDPERGRFRNWLGILTRNAIAKHVAREPRAVRGQGGDARPAVESLDGEVDPVWVDEFNQQILSTALARIRDEFTAENWTAFDLVWEQRLPAAEAAARLHRTAGWVYKTKFRILRRLKSEVLFLASDCAIFGK
ncbi:MAG: sigma-70 family RNA polymerase sigma factor [Planctomycetales bacterium]